MKNLLSEPLVLPNGVVLANRLSKVAMSEGMSDLDNNSTARLETLYRRWAVSGAGLLFTGNIQVDRDHLERPLNIVIDDKSDFSRLARLAEAGKSGGAHFWAQLSHPGRQVHEALNPSPLAPSAIELEVLRGMGDFAVPRAMTEDDIAKAIAQFAYAAAQVKNAGFTGVALHAAHGYLISQFLSSRVNQRDDRWGGSLGNRSRFLISVLAAVREAVGAEFPIGIKLNSSDFQRGGFTHAECIELVKLLNETSLDLLELSGGSLEQPKVMGITLQDEGEDTRSASTLAREAYFIGFAGEVRKVATMPVMVVGGFRTRHVMVEALENGELDLVGLGRPMLADPDAPRRLLSGEIESVTRHEDTLDVFHLMPWHSMQMERMGDGLEPDQGLDGSLASQRFVELETKNFAALIEHRAKEI